VRTLVQTTLKAVDYFLWIYKSTGNSLLTISRTTNFVMLNIHKNTALHCRLHCSWT